MIVDLKKVTLGWQLADDTLWVIEQIPGLVVGADQTTVQFYVPVCLSFIVVVLKDYLTRYTDKP